ncbi:MAG: twitching motility protein PilT [Gammaproteobacteria bacterium RIFCSPHIGHO2_12_FULL_37_14]|nr:MAG: twitching motility protein PilT [Gammaproteobacteria bacterium RIFCSPHIGHO2_12_FULL_37_14]
MILVDTTVWIDFFSERDSSQAKHLASLIEQQDELCVCGIVLTEILQGIKNPAEYQKVKNLMESLLFLDMTKHTYILAADIYRSLRAKGITIRKTLDCMIAAVAIEHRASLLHHDRDFDPIEKYCHLRVEY